MFTLPPANIVRSDSESLATVPDQNTGADSSQKRHFGDLKATGVPEATPLSKRNIQAKLNIQGLTPPVASDDHYVQVKHSEATLAIGEEGSEGLCTRPIWLAKEWEAESMPDGPIVSAPYIEEWMFEPEFLERAGGLAKADLITDTVAILMKEKGKILMLADDAGRPLF
ncbi:hypothetical protein [Endozoicomonas sp. 8E]|uniref:hypothetical protein n=1 Tax=Endozoicomonas sp. 8E TaxID=3035692 RepID=UPI0029393E47|nr:hypothetical protein [Endozoicomonas sp. 8E]WOG25675.1 hypothetical protein P6910_13905 [Endozoicomonas sp. 8E]